MAMDKRELITKFFELDAADESAVRAWSFFIDLQRAASEETAGRLSRRDRDNVQRIFNRYMNKNKLIMLSEDNGLKAHELAITKAGVGEEEKLKIVHSFDVWLLADFEDVCSILVADEPNETDGFPEVILKFLTDSGVHKWLKERLIEKNKDAGERLLKAILEDNPAELTAHSLLVDFYERESMFFEAEVEFRRMLDTTNDKLVWANYGYFLELQGRYEDAFVALQNGMKICERAGEDVADDFLEEVTRNISRMERMKGLAGEDARVVRDYQEAMRLLGDINVFAEKNLDTEITKARAEYLKEKDQAELKYEDSYEFMNWFLFQRELPTGKVPGIVYAEEKGLSDTTIERLKGLGNPVESFFEIVAVDNATFKLVVKDMATDKEYELVEAYSSVAVGQTFSRYIYPWGDFYFTAGTLMRHTDDYSETLKRLIEEAKTGKILKDAKEKLKATHDAFNTYFEIEVPTFKSKAKCEKAFNKFYEWMLFEYVSEEDGKTFAEIHEETHGQKLKPDKVNLPDTFTGVDDIALLCDPEYGIAAVRYYTLLKSVFETGAVDELKAKAEDPKELLIGEESFVVRGFVHGNERTAVKVFNEVFEAGLDINASEAEIMAFWETVSESQLINASRGVN
ncbi:MAG: hypothetical protein C5S38_06280 [Candidatus Methanophagaceae archaeon]|nr:MAG: hypothetical protein C5S38_06280 [Methanophagales archaeon]